MLPSTSVLNEPVTCLPDWIHRYAAIPNTTVSSGCSVNAQGNIPCDPAAMARAASVAVSRTVSLEAYTLARYVTSEVGTRSVPERVAVAQAAVNRVKDTERLGSVLDLLLYRQKAGHPNRGYYGPIHSDSNLGASYGRWAATSRDPALSNIIIAIDVLNGTIPIGFSKGADDQYGPEILVRKQGLEVTQNGVRRRGSENRYWVGPLPGVDHQRTFLYTTRKDVPPTSPLGQALIARGVAAIAAPRPNWTGLPTCTASWASRFSTGGGALKIILGALLLAAGGIAFAKAFQRRARLGSGLGRTQPYTSEEFSERLTEAKERAAFFEKTAASVQDAADAVAAKGGGWNGSRKVFIADVAKRLGTTPEKIAGPLLIANNRGWLELNRADLPGAMDEGKVDQSEVIGPTGLDRYHFVIARQGALGVTARRGPRTGAIEVDSSDVERVVNNAVSAFSACHPDDPDKIKANYVRPPATLRLGRVEVRDAATGEGRRVPVSLFTRVSTTGGLVFGAMQTAVRASDGALIGQSITLKPRDSCEYKDTWRTELAETLTHELAHAADPGIIKRTQKRATATSTTRQRPTSNTPVDDTKESYHAYQNDPVEVAANISAVRAELDKVRIDPDDAPDFILNWHSSRWNALKPVLTEANKRKFYKMAARVRDDRFERRAKEDAEMAARWAEEDAADEAAAKPDR